MQYFLEYESYTDHEIEQQLLLCNESANLVKFLKYVVDKIKSFNDFEKVKEFVINVLKKTYQVKKEMIPVLVSALLLVTPLNDIIEKSNVLEEQQKEFLEKIIQKREAEKEFKRISVIDKNFLDTLAYKESRNDWTIANKFGYIGKYQIGALALLDIYKQFKPKYFKRLKGTPQAKINKMIKDFSDISRSKKLSKEVKIKKLEKIFPLQEQEIAMKHIIANNEKYLRNLKKHIGSSVNDVKITWSGMIAAAHLKGARSVKEYLESEGVDIPKDGFGTTVEEYMKLFK